MQAHLKNLVAGQEKVPKGSSAYDYLKAKLPAVQSKALSDVTASLAVRWSSSMPSLPAMFFSGCTDYYQYRGEV